MCLPKEVEDRAVKSCSIVSGEDHVTMTVPAAARAGGRSPKAIANRPGNPSSDVLYRSCLFFVRTPVHQQVILDFKLHLPF